MGASKDSSSSIFRRSKPQNIRRSELNALVQMVESIDCSLIQFGNEISRHPAVLRQVLRAANSSLTGSAVEISEPSHAALFLGTRRIALLLNTLPPEIIEEDQLDSDAVA